MIIELFLGINKDIPIGVIFEVNDEEIGTVIDYDNESGFVLVEVNNPVTYLTNDLALNPN